jgi:hypothetical protein
MTAKLRRVEQTVANEPLVLESFSREAPMMAERADCRLLPQQDTSGRRLRNHILVANAIAWILIILLIQLIFF